jgi:hypothetical protein
VVAVELGALAGTLLAEGDGAASPPSEQEIKENANPIASKHRPTNPTRPFIA